MGASGSAPLPPQRVDQLGRTGVDQFGRTDLDQLGRTQLPVTGHLGWTSLAELKVDLIPRTVTLRVGGGELGRLFFCDC